MFWPCFPILFTLGNISGWHPPPCWVLSTPPQHSLPWQHRSDWQTSPTPCAPPATEWPCPGARAAATDPGAGCSRVLCIVLHVGGNPENAAGKIRDRKLSRAFSSHLTTRDCFLDCRDRKEKWVGGESVSQATEGAPTGGNTAPAPQYCNISRIAHINQVSWRIEIMSDVFLRSPSLNNNAKISNMAWRILSLLFFGHAKMFSMSFSFTKCLCFQGHLLGFYGHLCFQCHLGYHGHGYLCLQSCLPFQGLLTFKCHNVVKNNFQTPGRVAKRLFSSGIRIFNEKNVRILYLLNFAVNWRIELKKCLFSYQFSSFGVELCHKSTVL